MVELVGTVVIFIGAALFVAALLVFSIVGAFYCFKFIYDGFMVEYWHRQQIQDALDEFNRRHPDWPSTMKRAKVVKAFKSAAAEVRKMPKPIRDTIERMKR